MAESTEQRKDYARYRFNGDTQYDAYCKAYGAEGKTKSSIYSAASRLEKEHDVQAYLKQLNDEANKSAILQKQQIMQWLSEVIITSIGSIDSNSNLCQEYSETTTENGTVTKYKMPSKISAVQELSKLAGYYNPDKHDHKISIIGDVIEELKFQSLKYKE